MLLWPALCNGYPTIFSDTGGYLLTGKYLLALPPFRAPGYAVFTRFTSLGISAWFTIVAQAAMVVYVLYQACDYFLDGDRRLVDLYMLASICVLTALTSLPWLVSLVNARRICRRVVYCRRFLGVCRGNARLLPRVLLAAIFTFSIAAHASLFPIAVVFACALLLVRHVSWCAPPVLRPLRIGLASPTDPCGRNLHSR